MSRVGRCAARPLAVPMSDCLCLAETAASTPRAMAFQLSQQRRQGHSLSLSRSPLTPSPLSTSTCCGCETFPFVCLFALPAHCFVLLCFVSSCFVLFCCVLFCSVPVTRMFCACYNCALNYLQYVKVLSLRAHSCGSI